MFSALYQDALPEVRAFPAGLRVIHPTGAAEPLLVVKISKEGILAARLARGFKIYVCPSAVLGGQTVGLITAFFDTPDEPLVLRSPMFDDEHSRKLSALLQTDSFDVHFFDEHSRELLAHKVAVSAPERTRNELLSEVLTAFSYQTAGESLDRMAHWFGMRTVDDDALAMELTFVETLMPEDVYLIDLIPENNAFSGARSFHTSQLIREEPGAFQEHDIALLLMRVFPAEQIFKSPLKVRDGEEVSDLLVITSENVIFVQAKDSPNTREVLNNSLQRKMATTLKSLKKAIGQVRGALRYAKSAEPMSMLVGCKLMAVGLSHLQWRSLVVVKELFDRDFATYSDSILQLERETGVPCVVLDYPELNMYTANLRDEAALCAALDRVFAVGRQSGMLPRLRIGPDGSF